MVWLHWKNQNFVVNKTSQLSNCKLLSVYFLKLQYLNTIPNPYEDHNKVVRILEQLTYKKNWTFPTYSCKKLQLEYK